MHKAEIYLQDRLAGLLVEEENGYTFQYNEEYLANHPERLSVTFPLQSEKFHDKVLFPFFDGLIPEGWLLEIATDNWKLDRNDRMRLLLACCQDCIRAASVREVNYENLSLSLLRKDS